MAERLRSRPPQKKKPVKLPTLKTYISHFEAHSGYEAKPIVVKIKSLPHLCYTRLTSVAVEGILETRRYYIGPFNLFYMTVEHNKYELDLAGENRSFKTEHEAHAWIAQQLARNPYEGK